MYTKVSDSKGGWSMEVGKGWKRFVVDDSVTRSSVEEVSLGGK